MKRAKRAIAVIAFLVLAMTSGVYAEERYDPTFGSAYYADEEILAEYGSSEVMIPLSETEEDNSVPVDNSYKFLMIDGTLEKDAKTFTEAGTTLVPVRLISERLGANVAYKADEKKIIIDKDDIEIVLFSGSNKAYMGGKETELAAAVKNDGGTTYVPIRFIVENLGGKADYVTYDDYEYIQAFPTVVIDSAEFLAIPKMSDEEAFEVVKKRLEEAVPKVEEQINSIPEEYKLPDQDKAFAAMKESIENAKVEGVYASCYLRVNTEGSRFIVNKINGELFTERFSTFYHVIKPFEDYDIGNTYLYN